MILSEKMGEAMVPRTSHGATPGRPSAELGPERTNDSVGGEITRGSGDLEAPG